MKGLNKEKDPSKNILPFLDEKEDPNKIERTKKINKNRRVNESSYLDGIEKIPSWNYLKENKNNKNKNSFPPYLFFILFLLGIFIH